jgi:solute:Na+ symporter, SSS family
MTMGKGLHVADYIVIAGYFVLLTAIGVYFYRRMRHVRDLFTGGNNIPWWLAGVSFYLTGFSAFTFVAYSEMAYKYGFVSVTLAWSTAVAMAIGTKFLAAKWRRARVLSPVEFLEARYNKQLRQIIAWTGIPLRIVDDGLKIYATGVFVSVGMGFDLEASIVLSAAVVLIYTFMGGLWAVVITDYVQFIILTLGVMVLFPLVFSAADGFSVLTQGTPPGFLAPINGPHTVLSVFAFYLLITLSYNGNWAFAQKFYSTKNERDAKKAGLLAMVLKIIGPPLFILPAMAARSLLPGLTESPQNTYATLALTYLPAGLMGLMVAAMFSATMSTLSGDYNAVASVITQDIYARVFDKNASEKRLVFVGRAATIVVGTLAAAIGVAIITTAKKGLFDVMLEVFSMFAGPMLIPFLAGLLSRRVTARAAAAGIVAGLVSGLSFFFYKRWGLTAPVTKNFEAVAILVNFSITIGAMVVAALFERPNEERRRRIDAFFEQLERPIEPESPSASGEPAFSPMPVIGWVTIGTGILLLSAVPLQPGGTGRIITLSVALVLVGIGLSFHWLRKRSRSDGAIRKAVVRLSSSAPSAEVDQ